MEGGEQDWFVLTEQGDVVEDGGESGIIVLGLPELSLAECVEKVKNRVRQNKPSEAGTETHICDSLEGKGLRGQSHGRITQAECLGGYCLCVKAWVCSLYV